MMNFLLIFCFCLPLALAQYSNAHSIQTAKRNRVKCDIIVAGGSLAALSAALTTARRGHTTCLIEPTEWVGGQMTAQGVSAIDETWHTVGGFSLRPAAYNEKNQNKEFYSLMKQLNSGKCWVGRFCGEAKTAHSILEKKVKAEPHLKLFKNTVIKFIEMDTTQATQSRRIKKIFAIQRIPRHTKTLAIPFSQQVSEWYSLNSNTDFTKIAIEFSSQNEILPVIEGSEFGDVLALSGANFNQGAETIEGQNEINSCGQATVFPFVSSIDSKTGVLPDLQNSSYQFSHRGFSYAKIWSYRRVVSATTSRTLEKSLINWEQGNDYELGYLFKTAKEIENEKVDWYGGINLNTLRGAEQKAFSYFHFLRRQVLAEMKKDIRLEPKDLGTLHGLSLFPYVRDTRRSIGFGGFKLKSVDIARLNTQTPLAPTVQDSVAIGSYAFDVHPLQNECGMMPLDSTFVTTPHLYQIPLRTLTSENVQNLIPTGKTMAQSFLAASSTRIHPIEWSIGVGSGVAASMMITENIARTEELLPISGKIVSEVNMYQPTTWQIK